MLYAMKLMRKRLAIERRIMRPEDVKDLIAILMNSPLYLNLSVNERYGLVLRLMHDYPVVIGRGDTNLQGSLGQYDHRDITN
jgi:hypothetical protein